MMIRTAGGPGLVSPIDFHERKTPRLSRSAWTAIAIVAAAHIGVGVALYYQRFELKQTVTTEQAPTDGVFLELQPRPEIKPEEVERKPVAPNMPIHESPIPTTETEVLTAPINRDATPTTSTTVTLGHVVTESVDDAPPARETVVEPPAVRVIRNPSWVRQPSADQMMRAYPSRAAEAGLAGSASLNCMVEANGSVSGCSITGETPTGQGFGRAAQQLSRYFRINPRTVDGAAEGSRVAISLRFVPPAE